MTNQNPEIRRNDNGTLDEIVAENAAVHLEQMDDNVWWMSIETDGTRLDLWFRARGRIFASVEIGGVVLQ